MKIDPTGILYALVKIDADCRSIAQDYFSDEQIVFNHGDMDEFNWDIKCTNLVVPVGFARLQNGFIYKNEDASVVFGFDGYSVTENLFTNKLRFKIRMHSTLG